MNLSWPPTTACIICGSVLITLSVVKQSIFFIKGHGYNPQFFKGWRGVVGRLVLLVVGLSLAGVGGFSTIMPVYRELFPPERLPQGSLEGTLESSDGKLISGAHVVVWSRESPGVSGHAITRDDGVYNILHTPSNELRTMIIYKEGFQYKTKLHELKPVFEATVRRSKKLKQTKSITNLDLLPIKEIKE